uniref:Phosphoribosylanthranilate isomerase n=1 Tax=Odontella aurita TaxID=265563 RepID=A0A7S4JQJ8_9STRA|mmetsp:Transcript_51856/g.155623  ORF Transcript_51856/g.155623 Transcript_51856/m.155623 type:complete len:308 (+) Transcript_51856:176-1099(+)|eukprot:CAMPEP_0113579960 /NCGR_PEP_ID=MMETSP0015_2-20120614/30380_1 /TAXON_ID=2838 /ORGANISM="Odontella" /LENGTH=307 /DNA_ID=CAMNT_0000484041 /DNA_START=1123 /DNA_END=2046 /DNA_ORIENTATION=+ /assembly_acc=CAM_ASM_000160
MTNSAAKGIISTEVSSADPDAAGSGPSKGCGMAETKLRYVGFCGADDSVHPNKMALISRSYPWVEWGVLFRPDKEGQPRYATTEWRTCLGKIAAKNPEMKLAAHLCGAHVNHLLSGDTFEISVFLGSLKPMGFCRVQINATAVNGVDTNDMEYKALNLADAMEDYPELEFILQRNEETKCLWETILRTEGEGCGPKDGLPKNVVLLADESKGTGVRGSVWPSPPLEEELPTYRMGYAGGINPSNVSSVLDEVIKAARGREFWIDMESGVRSTKNGKDVFDLDKCYKCIDEVCRREIKTHPKYLSFDS